MYRPYFILQRTHRRAHTFKVLHFSVRRCVPIIFAQVLEEASELLTNI